MNLQSVYFFGDLAECNNCQSIVRCATPYYKPQHTFKCAKCLPHLKYVPPGKPVERGTYTQCLNCLGQFKCMKPYIGTKPKCQWCRNPTKNKCQKCGNIGKNVIFDMDPYLLQVHNREIPVWLCLECRNQ